MTAKDYLAFFVEQIHSIAVAILIQFNAYTKNAPNGCKCNRWVQMLILYILTINELDFYALLQSCNISIDNLQFL